ncbi:MAG: HAD family hydrolase [Promethearchaeota archaeon]
MIPRNEEENQRRLLQYLEKRYNLLDKNTVILLDADRTIYEVDGSRIFQEKLNIPLSEIKNCFKLGYVYEGFYLMNQIFSKVETEEYLGVSKEVARNIEFYPGFNLFIRQISSLAKIIIVSSGIKAILDFVFKLKGLSSIDWIAGTHFQLDDFLIGRNEKGIICEYFRSKGKKVIAFGDSDVDSLMLKKAHHAVVVVNHRKNQDLMDNLVGHPSISQISFNGYYHPKLPKTSYKEFFTTYSYLFTI